MKEIRAVFVVSIVAALLLASAVFLVQPSHVQAQAGPSGSFVIYPFGSDPCLNPSVPKKFGVVAISTATTTELVPAVAGKVVYLCGMKVSLVGASPTLQFVTGTKVSTPCDTAPTNQSGLYAIPAGLAAFEVGGLSFLTTSTGGELCLLTGATTNVQGNIVYTQQ